MATQQDVIKTFMKSLDDTTQDTAKVAVDEAFNTASNTRFRNMLELTEAFLNDYNSYPKWEDFLREKCGIILDNEDNGSITGLDAGGTKIKTDESIVPENTSPTDLVELYKNADIPDTPTEEILLAPLKDPNLKIVPRAIVSSTLSVVEDLQFTKKGLTVTIPNYNWIIESAESGDDEAKRKLIVINGLYSWWIENSLQLIEDSYGANFGFTNESSAATKEIEVNLDRTDTNSVCGTEFSNGKLSLYVYMNCFPDITETDTEGKSPVTGEHLDHTIAHEMTHAVMDVNIKRYLQIDWDSFSYNYNLPVLISEGIAELTRGIDKYRSSSITQALSSEEIMSTVLSNPYRTNYFKNKDGSQDNTNTKGQYTIGYMLLRYLAKQCATEDAPVTSLGANQSITCTLEEGMLVKANNGTAVLQKGDALVTDGYGNIATIKIGNENNIISTPDSKNMVVVKNHSGKNIASIFGSASVHDSGLVYKNFSDIDVSSELDNVSITGGNGNDVVFVKAKNSNIVSKDGNDKITVNGDSAYINSGDGNDEIAVNGDSAYINSGDGNNVVFIKGDKNTIDSNGGIDTITVDGNNNKLYGGDGADDADKFIIVTQVKNNTIENFQDGYDELWFETDDITAKVKTLNETNSVVISSAKTGDTLVVLEDVTSGSNDNIVYFTDDGNTVRTSIDWLLANTTPINPNPDDTEVIDVPVNGNVNNTRDDVVIDAVSGDNVIQNSGNNVTINGGTDRDEVTNTGNNVTIDGKAGNDILSNGSDGDSSSSSQSTRGGDNVVINGGAGLDLIYNYGGLNVQLNGAEGADTLYNSGSNTTITGGDGDDSINNENASEVTISGGNGKDTISNISANVSIDGGDGIDFIYNGNYSISGGSNVSISGGEGNDYISNWGGSKLSISGGAGNDYIFNNGTNVTILGDVGDDTITNRGTNSTIYSGDGKDSIENRGNYTSIDMGEGDNRIWNMGTNTTIHSSTGNDTVHNGGAESHDAEDVKIETGAGNDSIHNIRDNVTIDAGADNDSIYNDGDNVSIVGNTGDDTIRSELSRNVTISSGDGNDSISNNSSYTTIDAGDGDDNITINASDVLIDAGAGKDSIFLSNAYRGTVNSGTDNDYIETYGRSAFIKINAGDGDDSIKNTASETTIISGTGDDSIDNDSSNVTIDAGDGNDIIYNDDENVSISSGNGNDTIIASTGDHTTINAGAGNDSIYLGSSRLERQTVIQYNSGDGHDTIHQFYLTSTLNITGEAYSTQRSGNDIIVKVGNGSITLKDIQGFTPNIQNTFNGDDTQSGGNDTQSGGNDTQSGGNDTQSGGDDTQSGGDDTQSGGDDTQSGGDDTQSGGQDQTDTVRIVKNIVGLDLNYLDKVVVTDLDSLDDLIDERTVWLNFSSNSGGGFQNIDLSKSDYRQVVSLEGGNQKVTFNDTDRNVAIVGKNATGFKNIIFGNGDDVGLFFGSNAYTRATIGSGNDSILIDNNARVRLDMTKAEETSIIPYSGRVILDNYNPNSRASILFSDVNDVTGAIKDGTIKLVGDTVRSESSYVTVNDSLNGATLVNISSANGHIQKVGFTGINGGFIDAHDLRDDLLLKGNYAENSSDKQSGKRSTLISGTGNDTILAGARDTVDAGDGRNQIYLTPYDLREKKQGANIVLSGKGRNTVHSFQEGFDYDCVQVADLSNVEFKFQTDGLLLKSGDSRLKFDGIGIVETFSNSSGIPTNLDADEPEKITLTDGKRTINAVVAQTNQSVGVTKSNYYTPNAFFGNRSGLNFSNYRGDLNINLNDGTGTLDKVNATFQGINKLQAGTGMATLIGSDNRDTLIAGDGYSSLWGGAGNDKLIGRASSTDKDGRTTFFFFAGDGHDVIYDFNFLTPQNYYSGDTDKINIGDCDINDAYCSGDDVVLALDDDSYLTIKNAKEKNFQINHMIAQVGNELHYDGIANTFANNGNRSSSLIVDSSIRSAEIWLDSSHGTLFFGHISTLDASAVDGRTSLVGNEFNNTIIAGQDDASLWGGSSSSDDLLIGGNSRNTFFYCNGNGRDTIQATTDKDFVILSDVFLDEIVSTNISADFVDINFIDGGSLRINGNYNVTYQLADGSRYSANHEHLEWDSR